MSNKQGIVFGPWVGEFGWELFSWQAYCRRIARTFDYVVVISRPGNDYLYEDFCDIYLPFDPGAGVADSHMNSAVTNFDIAEFLRSTIDPDILSSFSWTALPPVKIGHPPYNHWKEAISFEGFNLIEPEYKLYRGDTVDPVDLVIHARNREIREVDNWSPAKWSALVALLKDYRVACIGRAGASLHIDGTVDFRDKSIRQTTGLLRTAKCIAGPSSGPLHLASLSGCPQVVWTSNPNQNYSRYKHAWNPFGTSVDMLKTPDPSVDDVTKALERYGLCVR